MYGLINRAVRDFVLQSFDQETWDAIAEHSGLEEDHFIPMQPYPDEVTFGLVASASEVLKLPPNDVLEAFGQYWTEYTAVAGYGELMKLGGDSLAEFIGNLDTLHTRVQLAFPELRAPSFKITESNAERIIVHYYSERSGLGHFTKGLLLGLGKRFNTKISVDFELEGTPEDGHEVFEIKLIS